MKKVRIPRSVNGAEWQFLFKFLSSTVKTVYQVNLVAGGHLFFTIAPWHVFNLGPVNRIGSPTRRILEENFE